MYTLFLCAAMLGNSDSQRVNAQIFHPSLNADYQYPTAAMSPSAYYLDGKITNQLSNFSMQSNRVGEGHELAVSGWSDGNDGGFSIPSLPLPGSFAGRGSADLPGKRDVQVALMENEAHTYIVVAYYDNNKTNYGYSLYDWNMGLSAPVYSYEFSDPHYPGLPYSTSSSMGYNRIAIDVSKDKQRIAFVLTDGNNSNMYTAVGKLMPKHGGGDSIFFSPNLPHPKTILSSGSPCPWPAGYDPSVYYCDAAGNAITDMPYNPLMRMRAQSSLVTSPGYRPEYKQLWPDVAFNENQLTYSFYCPSNMAGTTTGLREINVFQNLQFIDLYTYNGSSAFDHYSEYFEMAYNSGTVAGFIYDPVTLTGRAATSIILSPAEELRANLDAPDFSTGTYALGYAYGNKIYARYFTGSVNKEVIANNNSLINADITSFANTNPDISYNALGNSLYLAWIGEGNPAFPLISSTNTKSILGLEINPNVSTAFSPGGPTGSSASLASIPDYLLIPQNSNLSFGATPLVALSKHSDDLDGLYTSFCQEDESAVYSVMHKYHFWNPSSSSSSWRIGREEGAAQTSGQLSIAPNPFSEVLFFKSDNPKDIYSVRLVDMSGRQLYSGSGSAESLNADTKLAALAAGIYMMHSSDAKGNKQSIKIQKK